MAHDMPRQFGEQCRIGFEHGRLVHIDLGDHAVKQLRGPLGRVSDFIQEQEAAHHALMHGQRPVVAADADADRAREDRLAVRARGAARGVGVQLPRGAFGRIPPRLAPHVGDALLGRAAGVDILHLAGLQRPLQINARREQAVREVLANLALGQGRQRGEALVHVAAGAGIMAAPGRVGKDVAQRGLEQLARTLVVRWRERGRERKRLRDVRAVALLRLLPTCGCCHHQDLNFNPRLLL